MFHVKQKTDPARRRTSLNLLYLLGLLLVATLVSACEFPVDPTPTVDGPTATATEEPTHTTTATEEPTHTATSPAPTETAVRPTATTRPTWTPLPTGYPGPSPTVDPYP